MVAFILFCDEVQRCVGVFTNWHESKAEIFQQVKYSELAIFSNLPNWVTWFAEDGINWNHVIPKGTRTRSHYAPMAVNHGGIFSVGIHLLLADQEFQVQYAHFLADMIAKCWVWTTIPNNIAEDSTID